MKRPLLKPKAVAAQLDLGLTFVYLMLKSGKLPSIRLGNGPRARYRVDPEALDNWIKKRTTATTKSVRRSAMTAEQERDALGIERQHEFIN
jgi:excisionase family DNA binding protein